MVNLWYFANNGDYFFETATMLRQYICLFYKKKFALISNFTKHFSYFYQEKVSCDLLIDLKIVEHLYIYRYFPRPIPILEMVYILGFPIY